MRTLLTIVTTMALLAGCLNGAEDEPVTAAAHKAAPAAAADARAPEPPSARASPATTAENAPEAPDPAEAAPVLVDVPFQRKGTRSAAACAPAGPSTCVGPGLRLTPDSSWIEIDEERRIVRVTLRATWEAAAPTTERMTFGILLSSSCGEGCTEGSGAMPFVEGTSPLLLEGELPMPEEDQWFETIFFPGRMLPDPLYGYAHPDQAFTVEGTLTVEQP